MASNILWPEKYRPQEFEQLEYNIEVVPRLKKLISSEDFPHLLFYGPEGAGKRTLIKWVLNELFGPGAHRIKSETKEFKATASTSVDWVVYSSSYHQEVAPADCGRHDRVVVNQLIKEMAGSTQLRVVEDVKHSWKVIVVHDLDKLSREAQSGLRRTMEKYMHNCRIIFDCCSLSRVLPPLKSRCVQIRVPAPKKEALCSTLQRIAGYERVKLPDELAEAIAERCRRNPRRAIVMLQVVSGGHSSLGPSTKLPTDGFETTMREICKLVTIEQSPKQLRAIRSKYFELLVKGIPGDFIINFMAKQFLQMLSSYIKLQMIGQAVECEFRCMQGSKDIVHLEAFAAIVMMLIRKNSS